MLLTVYNFKGGQGKSKIALNLAYELGYSIITNDPASQLEDAFDEEERESRFAKIGLDKELIVLNSEDNVIYDLGGFVDNRVVPVLKKSDYIIIPITYENEDEENIKVGISTIQAVEKYNKSIIIIANKLEQEKYKGKILVNHLEEIKEALSHTGYENYPLFPLKRTRLVSQIERKKKPISVFVKEENQLVQHNYSDVVQQFEDIIKYINK